MNKREFSHLRKRLSKTQRELAQLLGTSVKAVHAFEQGWRRVPVHVERQLFFLISRMRGIPQTRKSCWVIKNCPPGRRQECPAWEFRTGTLCWFINGTICEGRIQRNWQDKMRICRSCEVLSPMLPNSDQTR